MALVHQPLERSWENQVELRVRRGGVSARVDHKLSRTQMYPEHFISRVDSLTGVLHKLSYMYAFTTVLHFSALYVDVIEPK